MITARNTPSVLIVEDLASLSQTYLSFLSRDRLNLFVASTGKAAIQHMDESPPDAVVLDVNLPDMNGLDILREIKRRQMPTEVVVITSNGSINLAIDAMREGAFDFVVKPCTADRLRVTVRNAIERRSLSDKVQSLREEFGRDQFCGFIGQSLPMQAIYRMIQSAAPSKATAFVTGESGTGKEVCAAALHHLSKRRQGPFVPLNCAAIPRDLLESELFGHLKGSFTGATTDRLGAAMRADGGTLFLDEIGEMEPAFQAKMLRFLQTGQVQRIGDDRVHAVDVRIVCATNRDPKLEVAAGRFREDLFYRLYVIPIELPPLRDREADVLLLARVMLKQYALDDEKEFVEFAPDVQEALLRYHWPGNVRELQNVVRKIVVLGKGPVVSFDMLPTEIRAVREVGTTASSLAVIAASQSSGATASDDVVLPLDELIDRAIQSAIAHCHGSIPKAATLLKVSPSTLYRRLQARANG
ncbi:MAG: sigma-54-dependent transcriptional regulator [Hyphomicrobiaceae bacterium]